MRKTRRQRFLSLILCLFMMVGPCSNLLLLAPKAAVIEDEDKLALTIKWDSRTTVNAATGLGTPYKDGSDYYVSFTVSARTKNGNTSKSTSVTVATLGLSARPLLGNSEFTPIGQNQCGYETFTLKDGGSRTIRVKVWNQKKYDDPTSSGQTTVGISKQNYASNTTGYGVKIGDTSYYRQFAVQIIRHDANAYISGNRTIRASLRCSNGTISTNKNSNLSFYPDTSGGWNEAMHDKGYSFVGSSTTYTNKSFRYRSNSGDPHMNDGKYQLLHNQNSKGDDIAWFMFEKTPWNYLKEQGEVAKLMNYFDDGLQVYVSGAFRHDAQNGTSVTHKDGLEYSVKYYSISAEDMENGVKNPKPVEGSTLEVHTIGKNKQSGRRTWPQTGNDKSTNFTRGDFKSWFNIPWGDRNKTLLLKGNNQEGSVSGYNKRMWDISMAHILINNESPMIEEVYVSQAMTVGSRDEDLFLMVRFNQPIQMYNISKDFRVKMQASDGNYISFYYVDGNYTDTLIFKADLASESDRMNYSELTTADIENIPHAAGLFTTTRNNNPTVVWDKCADDKEFAGRTVACSIDTRTPTITVKYDNARNEFPTSYQQSHSVELIISNMTKDERVEVKWAFATNRDINHVDADSWNVVKGSGLTTDVNNKDTQHLTVTSNAKLSGKYYLHIQVTSRAGMTVRETLLLDTKPEDDKTFLFDNTGPSVKASSYTGDGQAHSKFLPTHKIVLQLSDKHSGQINTVTYRVYDTDGKTALSGEQQVYPSSSSEVSALLKAVEGKTDLYEMELSTKDAAIPKGEYGAYTVVFTVTDGAGNSTIYTLPSKLMYDNRDRYEVDVGVYEGQGIELTAASPIEDGLGDYDIYYNTYYIEPHQLQVQLLLRVQGHRSPDNKNSQYELYSVAHDGVFVYERESGWIKQNDRITTPQDHGIQSTMIGRGTAGNSYYMNADITFTPDSAGRYDFIFVQNGVLQSEIVSIYVTPRDAKTTNYAELYSEERLLVNRVWQFSTNRQYKMSMSQATYYDGSSSVEPGQRPIFSSPQKALDYAVFTELQDLQLVTIQSDTVAGNLNSGVNTTYRKAAGETMEAAVGQTWIRYKSIDWSPTATGSSNTALWVYYYYSPTAETHIPSEKMTTFSDLFYVNELLYNAIQNNAKEIANLDPDPTVHINDQTAGWIYLTADGNGRYVDAYGQPFYSKKAIFYDSAVIPAGSGAFEAEMSYNGDLAIYDSFVDITLDGNDVQALPLVANFTFSIDAYSMTSFRPWRPSGETPAEWISIANGESLRTVMPGSGVYEIKELGGGFRKYLIYCDFDAPLVRYSFLEAGADGEIRDSDSERFEATNNGDTFRAKALTLRYIVSSLRPINGAAVELDEYSYIYLTQNAGAGMSETTVAFFTMNDFNAMEEYQIPDGSYRLYVYDRLGNSYMVNINANQSELITPEQEPVVEKNTSVTFRFNREKNQIAKFSITRVGTSGQEIDTNYQKVKVYVKSGTYNLYIEDIFGNIETRSVTLERDPPTLEYYYKNGTGKFQAMAPLEADATTPQGMASIKKQSDQVYTITSSTDVRIGFGAYAKYQYTISPADTPYKEITTSTHKFIEIPVTDIRWTLTVSYANDEEAKVAITCINDFTPPTVTAEAVVPVYTFGEEQGYGHVLFTKEIGTRAVNLPSGSKANAELVTFRWDDGADGSGVEVVYYTLNGGDIQHINPKDPNLNGQFTVAAPGTYKLTVKDLLDNTTEFTFTVSNTLDAAITLADGTAVTYPTDPLQHMQGTGPSATFNKTVYTGDQFSFLLGEEMQLTVLRSHDGSSAISAIRYRNGTLEVATLQPDMTWTTENTVTLTGDSQSGIVEQLDFELVYALEKEGLRLTFTDNDLPLETWQIRLSDFHGTVAFLMQMERSNRLPALTPVKLESGQEVVAGETDFTGINEGFTFKGDIRDVISITAYRSKKFTDDFSHIPSGNIRELLTAGLIGTAEEEGYYKVVITNKYGNQQIFLLRVNFGSDIDVVLQYDDFDGREHTLSKSGTYEFHSNESIVIRVWNQESLLTVTDASGQRYNPITRTENGCIEMTFKEKGLYSVRVQDDFGNDIRLSLDIQAPVALPYGPYLTGFNEDAVRREEQYTNAALSLSKTALEEANIAYVTFRAKTDTAWTVLYDILSQDRIDYKPENFDRSVGTSNGTYHVRFADRYGNICETEVHISDRAQLYVSRNTKNSAGNMDYNIPTVLRDGVWSNYIVRLRNDAEQYRLWVDGEAVVFNDRREYICELSLTLGDTAAEDHQVIYIDEYGNRYEFTIHLLRKNPVIQTITDGEEIVRNNTVFVKGSFGFSWEDPTVYAHYTKSQASAVGYTAGEMIAEDGIYTFTFTDVAGNIETRRISRDTTVVFTLLHGSDRVASGIAVTGQIRITEEGEAIRITEVLRNGEPYEHEGQTFREHGSYVVTLADEVGNTATVSFDLFNDPMKSFTYTSKGEYALYQVWYYMDGVRNPANGIMLNDEGHQEFTFFDDGQYEIDLLHVPTNTYVTYTVEIDNVAPDVRLVGEITEGVTRSNVTLEGLSRGDTVEIWLDGVLKETHRIGSSVESPEISKAGDYTVIIRDLAGNETVHTFVREFTTNTASNILICMIFTGSGIGCALLLHKRGRVRIK